MRLAELRTRSGLTQRQVADRMAVRQERVSAIERGDVEALQLGTLIAYAKALGGQVDVHLEVGGERLRVA
ncbi:hypothetical protein Misp01_50620 [Microtetraspora sp. NBRC 13810]|nr:hypothetical protein Misp01_50620 [Microtetraspora sp. NBRC 13810]